MKHVYFGWSPESTETYRWASNSSPKGGGYNGQTDPRGFRWFKIAPPGHVFGQKDLKQAEAKCVAYLAGAKRLLDTFASGKNLYIEQGRLAFKTEVKKDTPQYTLCKSVMHAAHYDEGPFKLAWDTGLAVNVARDFQENYHAANPEIRQWHKTTTNEVITKGVLEIPYFHRRRVFYEALSFYRIHHTITDQQRKDAIAWRPQTLVPQIVTTALVKARPQLPDDVWIHHHGHDSVIWSCPPELFVATEKLLDREMTFEIPINGRVMEIGRDTSVGYSVGDLMPWVGLVPTHAQWLVWRESKQKQRRKLVLEGLYGPHIKGE